MLICDIEMPVDATALPQRHNDHSDGSSSLGKANPIGREQDRALPDLIHAGLPFSFDWKGDAVDIDRPVWWCERRQIHIKDVIPVKMAIDGMDKEARLITSDPHIQIGKLFRPLVAVVEFHHQALWQIKGLAVFSHAHRGDSPNISQQAATGLPGRSGPPAASFH